MAEETGKPGPTPSEAIFFFNIVQHMKNKGDIDWDAVAASTGFKNAGVAKVRFGQIKRKYGLDGESPAKSPAKKNGKADIPSTPTKVTKPRKAPGSGRGRGVKKQEPEEDDLDEDAEETARLIKEEVELPLPFDMQKEEAGEDDDDWAEAKNEHPKDDDGFTYF